MAKERKMAKYIYGNELIEEFNKLCNSVEQRFWIYTPFIGGYPSICKIIGDKWVTNLNIDFRLLTDITNKHYIDKHSFLAFKQKGEARTLEGLHGKIYVIDNNALITSANLTDTAFTSRFEIGTIVKADKNLISLLNNWWDQSKTINDNWSPSKPNPKSVSESEEPGWTGFKKRWNLPSHRRKLSIFKHYPSSLVSYENFKQIYLSNVNRIWPKLPVNHEIDSFLNYLYHEHSKVPSKKFEARSHRKLSNQKRILELKKYHKEFSNWVSRSKWESMKFRKDRIKTIQNHLSPNNIKLLDRNKLSKICESIHSMNSLRLNQVMFLNPKNNDLEIIINSFNNLLHNSTAQIEYRMEECNSKLFRFGKSAIQELVSLYFPNKYPVINTNSNCGLKIFGYDLKVY